MLITSMVTANRASLIVYSPPFLVYSNAFCCLFKKIFLSLFMDFFEGITT